MAMTIEEFVAEREIKVLTHFTKASNLPSILQRGLVTRDTLALEGNVEAFNDQYRIDGTHAVCASISFPNYKMFWSLRQANPDVEWVVLAIHPNVLWETRVAFCAANAASASVTSVPLVQRQSLPAFEAMFQDFGDKARNQLNIPARYPTNPQAEVLLLDGVPRQYVGGVFVLNNTQKATIEAQHPGFPVKVDASAYRYRRDYEHWK